MARKDPHPWFYPMNRRVITTAVCAGWVAFEVLVSGDQGLWFWLALASLAYAVWSFFLSGQYSGEPPADET